MNELDEDRLRNVAAVEQLVEDEHVSTDENVSTDEHVTVVEQLVEDEHVTAFDAVNKVDQSTVMTELELNETIEQLCLSKAEEFHMIGYEHVTGVDIWECVSDKYHKKGTPQLYEMVNDILSLKVTQFMNFITLSMYRGELRKR